MYNEIFEANQENERFIIKRSGTQVPFEAKKIKNAISKANAEELRLDKRLSDEDVDTITNIITQIVYSQSRALSVEEIQDLVQEEICKRSYSVFLLYHDYRMKHQESRKMTGLDAKIKGLVEVKVNDDGSVSGSNEEVKQENSNKNPTNIGVQRDYIAGEFSRYYTNKYLLPEDIQKAHNEGIIHFHDADYFIQHMSNCNLVNLKDMLQNGTCISNVHIDPPKSFSTACTVASQIVAQVASSQYGGQSISLAHLAPFVDISRKKIKNRLIKEFKEINLEVPSDKIDILTENELKKEIKDGIQTIQYQLITLQTTNGQAPFVTVFMYLNEVPANSQLQHDLALCIKEMLKQRIAGVKDRNGNVVGPEFPKLIYVLQENNISEGTQFYELTKLAAKCTAKRMVPDYISEKIMFEEKEGNCYPCMGCRSFLTPYQDENGKYKFYGRFNQGVVTINLVDVACSSGKNEEKFWKILDERLELCHRALRLRHDRLLGTPSDVAPILWQDGALARLKPGEPIDKLLYGGYSTISLGYAGLAECVYYMKSVYHTDEKGHDFAIAIMQKLNDACAKWKTTENIGYSVYGTPLESTTYKFAKQLQRRFGIIENVTDHNYITNSYHICVRENINAFDKLTKEAEFQKLSPGGAISYVEVPNLQDNLPVIMALLKHIYETIMYGELNTKSDLCENCGFDGEIQIVEDKGKLVWECPNCHNRNQDTLHVSRRTCGYIGSQFWNQGRTQEIRDRVLHLSGDVPMV